MKKKTILLHLALVAAFSVGAAISLQQTYPYDTVRVAADDAKTAVSVVDVNCANIGYGDGVLVNLGVDLGL